MPVTADLQEPCTLEFPNFPFPVQVFVVFSSVGVFVDSQTWVGNLHHYPGQHFGLGKEGRTTLGMNFASCVPLPAWEGLKMELLGWSSTWGQQPGQH